MIKVNLCSKFQLPDKFRFNHIVERAAYVLPFFRIQRYQKFDNLLVKGTNPFEPLYIKGFFIVNTIRQGLPGVYINKKRIADS